MTGFNSEALTVLQAIDVETRRMHVRGSLGFVRLFNRHRKDYVRLRLLYVAFEKAIAKNPELGGADLMGLNLPCVNFNGADLRGAKLGGANVRDATFYGADLRGVNLPSITLLLSPPVNEVAPVRRMAYVDNTVIDEGQMPHVLGMLPIKLEGEHTSKAKKEALAHVGFKVRPVPRRKLATHYEMPSEYEEVEVAAVPEAKPRPAAANAPAASVAVPSMPVAGTYVPHSAVARETARPNGAHNGANGNSGSSAQQPASSEKPQPRQPAPSEYVEYMPGAPGSPREDDEMHSMTRFAIGKIKKPPELPGGNGQQG